MNEKEVQRQLQAMVAFIKLEADEKASEIASKSKEDFALEKTRLVQNGKRKIQKDFDAKEKQIDVQRKIAFSNELNQSRLSVLKDREESLQKILGEAIQRLAEAGKPTPEYKALLQNLIVEGLVQLAEKDVVVVCRKEDIAMVKDVLPLAIADARKRANNDTISAELTEKFNLAAARTSAAQVDACSGGVLLSAKSGKIICNQTLDARLSLAYKKCLPTVREMLFGCVYMYRSS